MPQTRPEQWRSSSFPKAWSRVTNGPKVRALRPTLSPVIPPNAQRPLVPLGHRSGSELDNISPITLQPGFYDRS